MYDLSKDYKKLYGLVCEGKRVAAFVDYKFPSAREHVMRDLCLVEKRKGNRIVGFSRGICYLEVEDWQTPSLDEQECFIVDCERLNLEFIK